MIDLIEKLNTLVTLFSKNIAQYKGSGYDEANARTDFIDKFFTLLDWDVANNKGSSEVYREVVREDKVRINGTNKAPDYSFRFGGIRKFFVEAKKPSVNIKDSAEPAYQVRRYAYTAGLRLSIITNFAEFAVYDTRIKPSMDDKASTARIFYCTFEEYEKHFDFLYKTFTAEAIRKGDFDRFAEENKNKKGTSEVDTELLALIEDWRLVLAKNIAKNNPGLSIYNLNTVVQRIIDRIVFIRIAEDRGIEDYELLLTVTRTANIYEKLIQIFAKANLKYNAGLFAYENWIDNVSIDDTILKNIIVNLYYPKCPYEFSVLPIEILGSIYERFLGKTIKFRGIKGDIGSKAPARTAIIEEKPEVKKAGGVYYTPQYIVDYIVQNTVGEKIKNKTPEEISKITICDPACGSGSFLVGAYQYLLNYHLDYYTKEKNVQSAIKKEKIYETYQSSKNAANIRSYKLTIEEKQRILTNSIFGVDIDSQAVEVTKLSLYLKLLENEGIEAKEHGQLFKHSDFTLLPSLENNIKCGNSLIGTDFYSQLSLDLTDDDRVKVNCFDWDFGSGIRDQGSGIGEGLFDIIIGNPPYVQTTNLTEMMQEYFKKNYSVVIDLYSLFIEKGLKLLRDNNKLGFITPSLFLKGVAYDKLRELINNKCSNVIIKEYGDNVFAKVKMPTCIILLAKGKNKNNKNYFENEKINLFKKIKTVKLGDISNISRGLEIGRDKLLSKGKKICLTGGNISVYYQKGTEYIDSKTEKEYSKNKEIFKSPKIMLRETGNRFFATIDYEDVLTTRSIYNTRIIDENYKPEFILGILNSSIFKFYFRQFISPDTNIFPKIRIIQLKDIPIPIIDISIKADKTKHDNLVSFVEKMLELKQKEATEQNPKLRTMISRQIEGVDNAIDKAVYELYNLSEDEIKVVEGEK